MERITGSKTRKAILLGIEMRTRRIILSAFALMAFTTTAAAQETVEEGYWGVNYSFLTYEEDGISEDFDLGALVGKVGGKFNPYVAGELRAGLGISDDSISVGGDSLEVELDHLIGAYAVVGAPNDSPVYPYAVVGMTQGQVSATATIDGVTASDSESDSDLSFGVGANMAISDGFQLNAEYMQYLDKDGVEVTGMSIGGQFTF